MNVGVIVGITTVIMGGLIVGTVQGQFIDKAETQNNQLQDQLSEFTRSASLSENPDLAAAQLRGATYLVTLRAVHCSTIALAVSGPENGDLQSSGDFSGASDSRALNILAPLQSLGDDSTSSLKCAGEQSVVEATGIEGVVDCYDQGIASCAIDRSLDAAADWVGLGDDPTAIEATDVEDQEGKFGNIKFSYPQDAETFVIQDDLFYLNGADVEGEGQQTAGIPAANPDNGDEGHNFWTGDGPVNFAPDPRIMLEAASQSEDVYNTEAVSELMNNPAGKIVYAETGDEVDDSFIVSLGWTPYNPAMANVPTIAEEPVRLYKEDGDSGNGWIEGAAIAGSAIAGGVVGFVATGFNPGGGALGAGAGAAAAASYFEANPSEINEQINDKFYSDPISYDNDGNPEDQIKMKENSFDYVICGGAEGRIQGNAGYPSSPGEATEESAGGSENLIYNFIEFTQTSMEDCREEIEEEYVYTKDDIPESGWKSLKDGRRYDHIRFVFEVKENGRYQSLDDNDEDAGERSGWFVLSAVPEGNSGSRAKDYTVFQYGMPDIPSYEDYDGAETKLYRQIREERHPLVSQPQQMSGPLDTDKKYMWELFYSRNDRGWKQALHEVESDGDTNKINEVPVTNLPTPVRKISMSFGGSGRREFKLRVHKVSIGGSKYARSGRGMEVFFNDKKSYSGVNENTYIDSRDSGFYVDINRQGERTPVTPPDDETITMTIDPLRHFGQDCNWNSLVTEEEAQDGRFDTFTVQEYGTPIESQETTFQHVCNLNIRGVNYNYYVYNDLVRRVY